MILDVNINNDGNLTDGISNHILSYSVGRGPQFPLGYQDVYVSLDDVVIMFHDPWLERTTDGRGYITKKNACLHVTLCAFTVVN